jgi:DNA-binding transcriptional LysR family regulator
MQLSEIEAVREVASSRSFRRAAEMLGLQQSTVSRRVRRLEDKIGVSLFERRPSGSCLTSAGKRFLESSAEALRLLEQARVEAGHAGAGELGHLRIGLASLSLSSFLVSVLDGFRSIHGEVSIEIADGRLDDHVRQLHEGRLDVTFFPGQRSLGVLNVERLWSERVMLVLRASNEAKLGTPIDWSKLAGEHFIASFDDYGREIRRWLTTRLRSHSPEPNICVHAVGRDTLIVLVALGLGFTIEGEDSSCIEHPAITKYLAHDEADRLDFSAAWSKENDNPALRRFLSMARAQRDRKPIPSFFSRQCASASSEHAASS